MRVCQGKREERGEKWLFGRVQKHFARASNLLVVFVVEDRDFPFLACGISTTSAIPSHNSHTNCFAVAVSTFLLTNFVLNVTVANFAKQNKQERGWEIQQASKQKTKKVLCVHAWKRVLGVG